MGPADFLERDAVKREDFLNHVGDPAELRAKAGRIEAGALELWRTVSGQLFTKAGKQKPNPPWDAVVTQRQVNEMRAEAGKLTLRAHQIEKIRADPWSHISPWTLRQEGLHEVAERVEAAHAEYIRSAEAA